MEGREEHSYTKYLSHIDSFKIREILDSHLYFRDPKEGERGFYRELRDLFGIEEDKVKCGFCGDETRVGHEVLSGLLWKLYENKVKAGDSLDKMAINCKSCPYFIPIKLNKPIPHLKDILRLVKKYDGLESLNMVKRYLIQRRRRYKIWDEEEWIKK